MKNTLLVIVAILITGHGFAQQDSVRNGGFERWGVNPFYDVPENWTTLNPLAQIFNVKLAFRTTDASEVNSGSSAIKLETRNIPGIGVTPSILTNGVVNTATQSVGGGSPISSRPVSFSFAYRFDPMGADTANASVEFTKWNAETGSTDLIGVVGVAILSTQGAWMDTLVQVDYSSTEIPDSVLILFNTGNPPSVTIGTSLFIDDVSYGYTGVGIATVESIGLRMYPNPATDMITISASEVRLESYQIFSLDGRMVDEGSLLNSVRQINVGHLKHGLYTMLLITGDGPVSHRFVKL